MSIAKTSGRLNYLRKAVRRAPAGVKSRGPRRQVRATLAASREHMERGFQHRRQQIVMDCHQLKLDADSYNENYNDGKIIQMVFDFRRDLEEIELISGHRNAA